MAHSEATIGYPSELWQELTAILQRYGLPEGATSFVLRAELGDVIRIECDFTPFLKAEAEPAIHYPFLEGRQP